MTSVSSLLDLEYRTQIEKPLQQSGQLACPAKSLRDPRGKEAMMVKKIAVVLALIVAVGACKGKSPTGPDPGGPSPPTPTLQLLDLKIGIADSSELGAPLTGPVAMGTRVRYTLVYGSPTALSGLTITFKTICNGESVNTDSKTGSAGAGSNNGAQSEFIPRSACVYTVQASMTGATPEMKEVGFEAR